MLVATRKLAECLDGHGLGLLGVRSRQRTRLPSVMLQTRNHRGDEPPKVGPIADLAVSVQSPASNGVVIGSCACVNRSRLEFDDVGQSVHKRYSRPMDDGPIPQLTSAVVSPALNGAAP